MSKLDFRIKCSQTQKLLEEIAAFGNRIAYSDAECRAVSFIVNKMQEMGLEVKKDKMGGIYGIRRGTDSSQSAVVFGSHIDSVPNGGHYDGLVGVIGGLGIIEDMNRDGVQTERDIVVACLRIEESALVGRSCVNSSYICGEISDEELAGMRVIVPNLGVETLGEAIARANEHLVDIPLLEEGDFKWGEFYELHIEQGHELRKAGKEIGVVSEIFAPERFKIEVPFPGNLAEFHCVMSDDYVEKVDVRVKVSVPQDSAHYSTHDGTTAQIGKADSFYNTRGKLIEHSGKIDALWRFCELMHMAEKFGIDASVSELKIKNASMNRIPMEVEGMVAVPKEAFEDFAELPWGEKTYTVEMTSPYKGKKMPTFKDDAFRRFSRAYRGFVQEANRHNDKLRTNVGKVDIRAIDGVPVEVEAYFSVRAGDLNLRDDFLVGFFMATDFETIEGADEIEIELLERGKPVVLRNDMVQRVKATAERDFEVMLTPAGAGHDAAKLDAICEGGAAVILIQNSGESHDPSEHCRVEDIVKGIHVLKGIALERGERVKAGQEILDKKITPVLP